jgi:plasmid maintenance system antidote protein VapI
MSKDIEQELRELIIKSKMSRYKISQISGVSEAQLSLFVNKKRTLTLPAAAKLAKVLGLELKSRKKGR